MAVKTPTETSREATLRARVIWAFWIVILLLGLPTWWTTTSIYRASLPTQQMLDNHENDAWYPIELCLSSPDLQLQQLRDVAAETQAVIGQKDHGLFNIHLDAQEHCQTTDTVALNIDLKAGDALGIGSVSDQGHVQLQFPRADIDSFPTHLAGWILDTFAEEHAAIAYLLNTFGKSTDKLRAYIGTLSQELLSTTESTTTRAFKPNPEYHLTFSLLTAGHAPSNWDIDHAINQYIKPLLRAIPPLVKVSVTSQIQLYSTLSPSTHPVQSETGHGYTLRKSDLTSFINTAEWPLSPSIGSGPTVNFVVYIPSQKYMPLRIENEQSNSWLIPQWGGITILNPPVYPIPESELGLTALPTKLDKDILKPAFENFQAQLLQLLGVSQNSRLPFHARIRSFHRLFRLSLYLRTSSNLASLARLEQHLSQIPIPKHVLHSVEHALSQLSSFRQYIAGTAKATSEATLRAVQSAYIASEKAFFDKSMVGQVYFPDEHKVAVYLPLLGPIGVPLVLGLVRELKGLLGRKS